MVKFILSPKFAEGSEFRALGEYADEFFLQQFLKNIFLTAKCG
jgi:hypothetical protein